MSWKHMGDSMIFEISWAAGPSWSGTVWFRLGMVPICQRNYQKFGESMFGKKGKKLVSRPTFHRFYSVKQGVAKLLTRDVIT